MSYVNFKRNLTRAQIEALGSSGHDSATDGKVYFATDGGIYLGASDGKAYPKANLIPDNLNTEQKTDQEFRFRKTGVDWDARAELITKFKGKTLAWNQIILPFNNWTGNNGTISYSDNILTYTVSTVVSSYAQSTGCYGTIKIVNTHKYYHSIDIKCDKDSSIYLGGDAFGSVTRGYPITANTWSRLRFISTASTTNSVNYYISLTSSTGGVEVGDKMYIGTPMMVDLTLLYGSEIDGMTDAEILARFEREFPGYHPYSTDKLISNDAESIETVGFNQWDEEWEQGDYAGASGEPVSTPLYVRSKNYISVFPSTDYCLSSVNNQGTSERQFVVYFHDANKNYISYTSVDSSSKLFTTPSQCRYIHFRNNIANSTYNHDICINISDPVKNGTYDSYKKTTLPLNLQSFKVKSPNIWDEQWENGEYNTTTGAKSGSTYVRSKNYIPVTPNAVYCFYKGNNWSNIRVFKYGANKNYLGVEYFNNTTQFTFTASNDCYYITFYTWLDTTYSNNITINLSDPAFNGRYFSHEDITIEGGLKGNGTWADYKDGKEYVKKANRVNLAGLGWGIIDLSAGRYSVQISDRKIGTSVGMIDSKYVVQGYVTNNGDTLDKHLSYLYLSNYTNIYIADSSHTTSLDEFINSLNDVYLDYELQYPETYELITPIPNFIRCDKDGTERAIGPDPDTPSAPFVADIQYGVDSGDVADEVDKSMIYASGDTVAVVGGVNSGDDPITKIKVGDTVHDIKDGNNPWESGENGGAQMRNTISGGSNALAGGINNDNGIIASGGGAIAFGDNEAGSIIASGAGAQAIGYNDQVNGDPGIIASGDGAHAEGCVDGGIGIIASGSGAHAEGYADGTILASGAGAHAEGRNTTASEPGAHAEGIKSVASGYGSHAEGSQTEASGESSHAEGEQTEASGDYSHAEGAETAASGFYSHVEGYRTVASNDYEHASGMYNKSNTHGSNTSLQTLHSVGVGTANNARVNAFEIMKNGDVYVKGVGGYDGTNPTSGTNDLASFISGSLGDIETILQSI